jgi:hypothetical protein
MLTSLKIPASVRFRRKPILFQSPIELEDRIMEDQNTDTRDIQRIIDGVRNRHPEIAISQLQVLHPGNDDDGLWFFAKPAIEVQLESSSGKCPFLIETSGSNIRRTATSVEQAIQMIESLMNC